MTRRAASVAEDTQRRDRGATAARHVEVGHREDIGDVGLFRAQGRVGPNPCHEPVAEMRLGLEHAATDEVDVGIDDVGDDREQAPDGLSLSPPLAPLAFW